MIYNFWCTKCDQYFKKDIKQKELYIIALDRHTFEAIGCIYCDGDAKLIGRPAFATVAGKWETPVSVATDDRGREYEINNKGKVIPEAHRKYKNDPRGWRRKGKKSVRQIDQYGKENNR